MSAIILVPQIDPDMSRLSWLFIVLLYALPIVANGQILTFEFSSLGGSEATANSNFNNANLGGSTISRGAGLTASGNGGRFNATSWALTSIANAVSGDDYMEFTISPNAGYQFSVSSIYVQLQRSGTGPRGIALRSSVDNYATNLDAEYSITDNTSTQNFTFTFAQANSSAAVTYRVYMYAEATGGSGGIGDGGGDDIVVNGTVTSTGGSPALSVSPNSLTGFSTTSGTASTSQSYDLSGGNLSPASGNIVVTAPTDFEVSLDNSSFSNSLNVPYTGGALSSTTIYARIKASASVGSPSGNITNAGGGATTQNVAVDGTVTAPITPCSELFISEYHEAASGSEKYIEIFNPTGSAVTLTGTYDLVNYANGSSSVSSTLALTGSIAAYGTVYAANTSAVLVSGAVASDNSVMAFNGNDAIVLRKNGTNIDVVGTIGSSATFAQNVYLRRNASVDQPATTYNASEWSSGAANDVSDIDAYSSDCVPAIPLLSVTPTALTGFLTSSGTASASQSFDLTGSDLSPASGNLTVAAPTGFEVSTNNSTFSPSVSVAYTGGTASQTIYVRIASTASVGSPSGNVVNSGGGATSVNVAVDGTVCPTSSGTFSVGDISFVGFGTDDPDQFSFVTWVSIPNGTEINFTENAWTGSALNSNEGTVTWQNNTGSAIDPGTVIVFDISSGFDLGTTSSTSGSFALSTGQDNLFAYEGTSTCPSFIYGISNNPWITTGSPSNSNSYLPAQLNVANGNMALPSTEDNWEFSASRNDQTSILDYKPIVNNSANWTGNNTIFTLSSTDFTLASTTPSVELSASAGSGSEAAASVVTITATASAAVTGNQTVTLAISGAGITASDYNLSNAGVITILNGQTTGTVTFTIVDDALFEGSETATLSYTAGSLSAGLIPGTSTSVSIDIADNDGATFYSQASGGTTAAIWDIIPNGVGQTAASFGGFSANSDVIVQTGHTVDITTSGLEIKNLTVQSGAKFYANNSNMGGAEYVRLFGSVTNGGMIGNGNTPDNISFELRGTGPITFTGNGNYDLGRIRKEAGATGTLTINSNVNLGFNGASLFVNNNNLSLDVIINAGKTVRVTSVSGDVAIDGTNGASGGERGGSILVNGTLEVANKLFAISNNSTLPCSISIGSTGRIIAKDVDLNIDGTGFTAFDIASGGRLEINGVLSVLGGTLNSNNGVIINSGATLLHGAGTTGGGGSVTGNVTVKRQGTTSNTVFNFWSSPVQNGTVPGNSIFSYNSDLSTQDYSDDFPADPGWEAFSGTMTVAKGYTSRGGALASFYGPVNNGTIPFALTYHAYSPGNTNPGTPFNLVGNPYPGAISASSFVGANSNINGSLYFWDDDLSGGSGYSYTDYAVWNGTGSIGTGAGTTPPNGFIASGQGFLVRALNSGNVNFSNSMRVSGPNNLFFKPNADDSKLWLSLEGDNLYNEILIGMLEDATEGEDRLYDAVKVRGNTGISLAAVDANNDYAIMAFPPPFVEKTVPLSVSVGEEGPYNFTADRMLGFDGYQVWLEDNKTAQWLQLLEGTQMSVLLTEGEHIGRFYLHFKQSEPSGVNEADQNTISAFWSDDQVVISVGETVSDATVEIISSDGRVVYSKSATSVNAGSQVSISMVSASSGVYMVRVSSTQELLTQRFIKP